MSRPHTPFDSFSNSEFIYVGATWGFVTGERGQQSSTNDFMVHSVEVAREILGVRGRQLCNPEKDQFLELCSILWLELKAAAASTA